jgi:hypothetical protein
MIKPHTLDEAIIEAARFIKAARLLRYTLKHGAPGAHPRERAGAHRASMDLTRKLADLRQGR